MGVEREDVASCEGGRGAGIEVTGVEMTGKFSGSVAAEVRRSEFDPLVEIGVGRGVETREVFSALLNGELDWKKCEEFFVKDKIVKNQESFATKSTHQILIKCLSGTETLPMRVSTIGTHKKGTDKR